MSIYVDVKLAGETTEIIENALVDTGAEISMMPLSIATNIGAWSTNQQTNIIGVHRQARMLPIIVASLYFPSLNNVGGQVAFAMSDIEQELIIGMDILKPLGIIVDTKTNKLTIKNEVWEAFKSIVTTGVIIYAGIKILGKLPKK